MKKKFIKPTLERKELIDQPLLVGSGSGGNTGGNPGDARAKSAYDFNFDY